MSISPTSLTALGVGGNGPSIGRDAFLDLLVLQLRNQDPLNPLDNEAMLAQLAQFSQLEELRNLNVATQTGVSATESVNNAIATTLIGKDVKAVGKSFTYDGKTPARFEYALPTAGRVEISVLDEDGRVVHSRTIDEEGPGFGEFTWDGTDASGNAAKEGLYDIRVSQTDSVGNSVQATTFVTARVTGVRFTDGITYLLLGDQRVSLSEVLEINAPSDD